MKFTAKAALAGCVFTFITGAAMAQNLPPLNSGTETDRIV